MSDRADNVIEAARVYVNKMAGTFDNAEPEFNALADALDAYLNEKPHEPHAEIAQVAGTVIPPSTVTWTDGFGNTGSYEQPGHVIGASPPHAAADEWEQMRDRAIAAINRAPSAAAEPEKPVAWIVPQLRAIADRLRDYSAERGELRNFMANDLTKIADALASPSAQPIAREPTYGEMVKQRDALNARIAEMDADFKRIGAAVALKSAGKE